MLELRIIPLPKQLEEMVALLEAEVAHFKARIESGLFAKPWWEKITETFTDNPTYNEAIQLGREHRGSLRSNSSE